MSIKKLFLIGVLGLSFCMTGCGNGQKVDSEKEFSTNDISEIVINNSSWNLKILASSDDKIHVSYDGKIEDGVSNIQILQNESQLVIQILQHNFPLEKLAKLLFIFRKTLCCHWILTMVLVIWKLKLSIFLILLWKMILVMYLCQIWL